MNVRITPEAEAQIRRRRAWWLKHRDKAPGRFDEELTKALGQIGEGPSLFKIFVERKGHLIRRCLMRKTLCHLYFTIDARKGEAWVVAAGGGQRQRVPPIKLPPKP